MNIFVTASIFISPLLSPCLGTVEVTRFVLFCLDV
jgi:hypothetical protein